MLFDGESEDSVSLVLTIVSVEVLVTSGVAGPCGVRDGVWLIGVPLGGEFYQ